MTKLKSKINRFFYNNQNKGVRNLMLYIAIGNALVYLVCLLLRDDPRLYDALVFNRADILHGQVWRLFTYPLVYMASMGTTGIIWGAIGLFFYYWCGNVLEQYWGVLRFNAYYLAGILLTDIAALILGAVADSYYVNLSLFLAVATLLPDQQIRIWFVIPVKMKWLAWIDLGLTLIGVIGGIILMIELLGEGMVYLGWLLPLAPGARRRLAPLLREADGQRPAGLPPLPPQAQELEAGRQAGPDLRGPQQAGPGPVPLYRLRPHGAD